MNKKSTPTELYAWNFLEEHKESVLKYPIAQVALMAHVSSASIIRTVKKHGYTGFSDYKSSLKSNVNHTFANDFSDEANHIIEKTRIEVERTMDLLDAEEIEAIVDVLIKKQNVIIMASGPTRSVADYMSIKFQLTNKDCITIYDKDYMAFKANNMKQTDLLIVLSLFGETEELIIASKVAQRRGAKVLVLTSEGLSTLAQIADYKVLCYKSKITPFKISMDVASRFPLEISARILLDMYAMRKQLYKIQKPEN